ncbi:MAG: glutamate racemase [Gammaproteobacteria bacterium]|nr:glutamate racemase [Gammaproteobacteria bacterium]
MAGVAIFDSGVGGLSIAQEIQQQIPALQLIFVSDNEAFPYGTKNEAELTSRVSEVAARIIRQFQPDMLVIACNTASTVTLPTLREQFELPIVGVVPAIKPAAQLSHNRCIGVLATPATIGRAYTQQLSEDYASDCEVLKVGSSALVQQAEQKLAGKPADAAVIEAELAPFLAQNNLDILVLACTHFPLLNNEIEFFFKLNNHPVQLLDSGAAIARRVASLTTSLTASPIEENKLAEPHIAAFTDLNGVPEALINALHKRDFKRAVALN